MSTRTVQTGECPVCGDRKRLRANGTMWHHTDKRKRTHLPFSPRCEGADNEPKDGTAREEK